MNARRALAGLMVLATGAWAAWLFGSVDWAGAQREAVSSEYVSDTGTLTLAEQSKSAEKAVRVYLQEAEQAKTNSNGAEPGMSEPRRSRDLFAGRQTGVDGASIDDGLDVIYLASPKIEEKPKPAFPVERYKLTGVMLGSEPRAFVRDTVENKSLMLRINDKIGEGAVTSISSDEIVVMGNFGKIVLTRTK